VTATMAAAADIEALFAASRDGDMAARDALVEEYLPLVRSLAARYAGRGEPFDDLLQVGSIGLLLAIDRFDPDRGVRFTTYAVPTVVGEIQRHFRDRVWALHVPRGVKDLSVRISRLVNELSSSAGRPPTVAELAVEAGVAEDEVIEALEAASALQTASLQQPLSASNGDQGTTLEDTVGEVDTGFVRSEDEATLAHALGALDERERRIVELRFRRDLSQSEIAAEVGISQMHVSRLLRKSLAAMRGRIEGEDGKGAG
jgi:RNA polymerase sigma-B factor